MLIALLLSCGIAAAQQQAEVSYSDDFQSYGSPKNPPGWVDTAIGSSKPVAEGLFKTWPDPTQGSKATNVVFGSKSASGRPEGSNPRIGHFSTLTTKNFNTNGRFEYRGRFLRTDADARIGFTFLSSYPERDSYYLIGLWSVPNSADVTMQLFGFGAGTLAGTTNSAFTPAANTWYRFLIQVDDVGGVTKIRARFWPDGSTEPSTYSIDATDAAATRLTTGRIGLWAASKGANYWDDLAAKSPVDHTAPVITFYENGVVLPPNTTTNIKTAARVDVRATDDLSGVATVTATVDGQPYTPLTPITVEGPHVVAARAVDNVGNSSTSETTVLVDATPPVITLTYGTPPKPLPLPLSKFNTVPAINIDVTDRWTGATYVATLDGQPYTTGTPIAAPGRHTLIVEAVDGVKNRITATAEILVDLAPAVIEFYEKGVKLQSPATFKYDPAIEVRLTDTHSEATYVATLENGTAWKSFDPVPTGWHKITVTAVDEAGNSSSATLDVLVDKDAPAIVIRESGKTLDPALIAKYRQDLALEVSITDATSAIKKSATTLNGVPYTSGTLITEERNTHTLVVRAEDEAGNVTEVTLGVLLDKTAPVIAFSEGGAKLDVREPQKFRRDAAIDIAVTDAISTAKYTATITTPARGTSGAYKSGTLVTIEDTHKILVEAEDDAGNKASSTLTILIDKTLPVIAFSESGQPLDTTQETPYGRDVKVDINVTDNLPGVTFTAKLNGTDYVSGTPITTDGHHVVSVVATDAAENVREGAVKLLVDKSGPAIEFRESGVLLETRERNDFNRIPSIEIVVKDALSAVTYAAKLNDAPYTSGTPIPEGHHSITVTATDARGNATPAKLDLLIDTTAPVVKLKDKTSGNDLPPTGAIFNRDVTVDTAIQDISKTTTTATLDGAPFSLSVPVSQEGLRSLAVTVEDELKWKTTVATSFTVDKSAPELLIKEGETPLLNGASFARNVVINLSAVDITAVQITATIDGQPYVSGTTYTVDGTHTLVVNAVDAAGNRAGTVTLTFHIDKNAPEVALLETGAPFPVGKTFTRDVVITATVKAATETTTVATIDDAPYTLGAPYAPEGRHRLKVVVTNIAGLKTTVEADFAIDKTPPTLTLYAKEGTPFTDGMKFGADLTPFTVADDNLTKPPKVVVLLDGAELPPNTVVSEEKFHTISATATDDGGLTTSAGPFGFVLDKTPPKVKVTVDGADLVDGAKFNKAITPLIEAEDLTTPVYTITLNGESYTRGTLIDKDAKHTLVVRVKDDLGNERVLDPIAFTVDKTPPQVRILDKATNETFSGGQFKRPVTPVVQIDDLTPTITLATLLNRGTKEESPWTSGQEISSDGHYTLRVTVTDDLEWVTVHAPIDFTIDQAAPVIEVTEGGAPLVTNTIFNRNAVPKITVTDTTTPTIEAKLNDQPFTSEAVVAEERKHTLTVKATDQLGFVAEILPIVFTVDKTPPVVEVRENGVAFNDGALLDHDAVPQVIVTDLTATTTVAKVDGQPFSLGGSVTAEGPHTFDVTVTDAANWSTTKPTIRFVVDKTAPEVRITEGENGGLLESGDELKITITPWIHIKDITATTTIARLNGQPWTPNTPVAEEGKYVLEVTVTDAVGRTTIHPPIAFIIDKSAPSVRVLESSVPLTSGKKFNRPAQLSIEIKDLTKTTTVAKVGDAPLTFPGTIDADGKHTLTVTVTDNLGQATVVDPIAFTIDQTRPEVLITESGQPLQSGAAFKRNVKPEITIKDLTQTTTVATLNGAPFTFGTEIAEEGKYTLAVEVTDELGWTTVVPAIVFFVDRTPPVVVLKEGENDLTDGLWFNRDVSPRAVVTDTTDTTKTATLIKDGGAAQPYTLETPITAEGKYTLSVAVTDAVGLKTDVAPVTFTIDKTPPALTIEYPALNASLTTQQVIVTGGSDDAVSVTVNEVETAIDTATKKYVTTSALELLEGDNTLVVFGIDRAGNNTTITHLVRLDTRAPQVTITAPAANACLPSRSVQVTGTVADPNVAAVRLTFNPPAVPPVEATLGADRSSWAATVQFPAEGKFVITATASDTGGHESAATRAVSIDETKPVVEVTADGAAIPAFVNRTLVPNVRIVDADAKATVVVTLDGQPYTTGTAIAAEKAYELKVVATDCAGNKSDETVVRFTIDKTPPQFLTFSPGHGTAVGSMPLVSGTVSGDTISVVAEDRAVAGSVANGAFSFADLPVGEGSNRFVLVAVDRGGNATRFEYTFTVKTTSPTVEILESGAAIVEGARYSRPVTVEVRSNEPDAVISATHNGQSFTSAKTISDNGSHTIKATARDRFDHSSSREVTFTIDNTGPVVTISEPQNGASVTADRVRVRGTVSGDPISATINGAPLTLTAGAFDAEVALELGLNDITVQALDAAGNVGQASIEVTRSGGTLGLLLTSPQNNQLTNRRAITVAGQVLSPAGVTHVSVNGIDIPIDAAGAFRKTDFALSEGQNVITATVRNAAAQGNVSVTVTADFTPPVITVTESGSPLEEEARFTTQAVLTVGAADAGQAIAPAILLDAATATSPMTVSTNGGHTLVVTARDAAGNEKRVERTFFIGAGGTAACALTDFDPANNSVITSNTVTLVGRTGGAAGVKVNGSAANVANSSFSATVNLPVEGPNSITITCTDAAGNPTGNPATIALNRVTGSPSITITEPKDNDVTISETITVDGTISADVAEVTVNGSAAAITGTTFRAVNVRLAAGLNVVVARAKNGAGRTSSDSIRVTFLKNLPTINITAPAGALTTSATSIDVSGLWSNLDPATITVTNGAANATAQTSTTTDTSGTFIAATVPLVAGANTITVRGTDRKGRAATATMDLAREAGPSIAIAAPLDNAYYGANAGDNLTVSGTYTGSAGAAVEVNGGAATTDAAASTFTATVPFSAIHGGLTPIVARVTEPSGATSLDTVRVIKLTEAPAIVQTFPEANATNVSAGTLPLILFSTAMDRVSARDAFRLENAVGTAISGTALVDRDVLTFAPAVLLEPGERYTMRVSTAAKDLGGNALATAFSSTFTVTLTSPGTAPSLAAHAPRACEALDLSGTAPPSARLRIDLGTLVFNTTASASGAFTFRLPLSGRGGFQVARVRIVGSDGSLSPAAEASFEVDCAGPHVTEATFDRTANLLRITFSKPIDLTTVTASATGSVRLQLLDGAFVNATAAQPVPTVVALTPAQNLGSSSFTLTVTTAVKDTTGAALSSPYSRSFSLGGDVDPGDGSGYIAGEIFDAATGRPLPGANVTIDVPTGAFGRTVGSDDVTSTNAAIAVADNRGRYVRSLPEGAHTIRASAEGYTTVWRQIIVRAGAGIIPTDIRLTPRGATKTGTGAALVLTDGGEGQKPLSRRAELRIPAGIVATGSVTLTSLGAQSLPGLLPLGWSPMASAEIVSNAASLSGSELTFDAPKADLTSAAQTLTAVRYFDDRDEWRVLAAVVSLSTEGKATVAVSAPGAYALVYPDRAPHLQSPPVPTAGGALVGVADPCATATCPALTAKNALELVPPVVLPTQRTVATLRIEGAGTSAFPSGTAVQAYVDEELHLADGTRDVVSPFVTDLLLYRTLDGDTGEAAFHLAPSARASEVVLKVGYDHIRILPYPERLDRGALIGPEGGRVPGDDKVAVELPAGATAEPLKATAVSISDFSRYGAIPGYRIVGGLSLSLQWAAQTAAGDATPVELLKPARATFTVVESPSPSQLVLVELLEGTAYGRVFRLAAQTSALEGGTRFATKTIDRALLPVDGIIREGTYLLLAPNAPIAFATGTVHLGVNGPAVAGARVLTPPLGVFDLSRGTGIFNVPVPAATFTLIPRTVATGDGTAYSHPSAPAADQIVNVGALSIVAQPPSVTLTVHAIGSSGSLSEVPAAGATNVSPGTSVKASFSPGLDPLSVRTDSITVIDEADGTVVGGRAVAQGTTAILWTPASGVRLRVGGRFTAIVSGAVRGLNGTPLGTAATATFSTAGSVAGSGVNPTLIRITIPDADGRSSIIGAPGSLQERFNAVAVRRGRDFSNRPQATGDSQAKFRIELGTTGNSNDRVTLDDLIDLHIVNEAGSVAAIVPLGPFASEDGRGFVARPGVATRFTTADNVTIAVPAEAFDVPTVVATSTADKSVVSAVPSFDQELKFHAGFKIDFEGIAKKRLDISFPAPATLPQGEAAYLGMVGNSVRGPRVMLIDLLRRDGANLTTEHPETSNLRVGTQSMRAGSNAIVNPTRLRDMLLGIDRGSILIGLGFQTPVVFIFFPPPSTPLDFFVPPINSLYYASFAVERDRLLVPVPAARPFNIVGVDPGSGLTVIDAPFDARQPGEPGDAAEVTLPSTNEIGPYPVFASPGRTEILDITSEEIEDESIRNFLVVSNPSMASTVLVKNSPSAPLPPNTRVEILNLRTAMVYRFEDFAAIGGTGATIGATVGDRLVFMIGTRDVDPSESVLTVAFSEPLALSNDQNALRQQFKLQVADPTITPLSFSNVLGTDIRSDSGKRRISVVHRGSFQRGKRYRLTLANTIKDQDATSPLRLGQKVGGAIPSDLTFDFQVREPKGPLTTFHLNSGGVRDLAMSGNVLFVSALEGGIVAFDVSDPAKLKSTYPPAPSPGTPPPPPVGPTPMGHVPPPPGDISATWALAADQHGRLFATAVSPMLGVIRSYRVEDFYCLPGASCPAKPPQTGNAVIAWRTGINVGVDIAAMMIGGWPEAMPRKMSIVTKDSQPVPSTFPPDPPAPPGGGPIPGALGNGFRKIEIDVSMTLGLKYDKQRVTVTNVTRGFRFSKDISGSDTIEVIGRAGDQLRVEQNLSTIGVVSLYGHGVGVYDLNAIEANYRHIIDPSLDPDWERLQDNLALDTGDGGSCGLNAPCDNVQKVVQGLECPISDLAFSPDAALANIDPAVGVFALVQNRGIAQLTVKREPVDPADPDAPNVSCGRTGTLILQEQVNLREPFGQGRRWAGHPRLNQLRLLFRNAAGRDPIARYTNIATYKHANGSTYLLVAGNEIGLAVAKIGTGGLSRSSLVDVVWIPGGAYSVRVMQDDHLAVVVDGKKRVLLVNLAQIDESSKVPATLTPCTGLDCVWDLYPTAKAALTPIPPVPPATAVTPVPNDANGVGWDDPRIVWKSAPGLITGTLAPIVDSETGFIYGGDVLGRELEVIAAVDPTVRFIGAAEGTDLRPRELSQIVPLGIKPKAPAPGQPNTTAAAFQVIVSLPGSITETLGASSLQVAVESELVPNGVAGQTPTYLPRAHLRQTTRSGASDSRRLEFALQHDVPTAVPQPELRYQRGWNRMVSKWIVAIADPRAADAYDWGVGSEPTAAQKADRGCYQCEKPSYVLGTEGTDWYELYTAGRVIAVRPERCATAAAGGTCGATGSIFGSGAYSYLGDDTRRLETRIATIMADTVRPTPVLTAAQGAPIARGAHQETFFVHSGEVLTSAVDLDAGGRAGWNVIFDRTHRSRTLGYTPLGAGWDSSLFQRLRLLPTFDVEYRDGSGEVWRFEYDSGNYKIPDGMDVRLARHRQGWRMTDAKQRITDFDELGRVVMQADEFYDLATNTGGNVITYSYDADGQLKRVVDPVGRMTTLEYTDGRLSRVLDWRGREVKYDVKRDTLLLENVELPERRGNLGYSYLGASGRPKQKYVYGSAGGSVTDRLELGTNIKEIHEPGPEHRVSFEYETSGAIRDMVKTEQWQTTDNAKSTFVYTVPSHPALPVSTETKVTDALNQERKYTLSTSPTTSYRADRVHISKIVETAVPIWGGAAFGALPMGVQTSTYSNNTPDRTFTFEYLSAAPPPVGPSAPPTLGGRLFKATVSAGGDSVTTEYGWTPVVPAGAVLNSRKVTSSAGGIAQSFVHTDAYLDSVTSDGLTLPSPEPRRATTTVESTDGDVKTTRVRTAEGLPKSVKSEAAGALASGAGAQSSIDFYHPATDTMKHRRGLPNTIVQGAGGEVQTEVKFTADQYSVTYDRVGRNFDTKEDYDEAGNLIRVTVTGDDVNTDDQYAYDARGRLVRHRTKQEGAKYVEERYEYDQAGRVKLHETYGDDGGGLSLLQKTSTTYNLPGRVITTELPDGGDVTANLDGLGRVQDRVTDPENPHMTLPSTMTERTRYDLAGNVVFSGDDRTAVATRYDGAGRPQETIDSAGIKTTTKVDGFGRMTDYKDLATGFVVANQFTPGGKQIFTKTNTSETTFAWDGAGRTRKAVSSPGSGTNAIAEREYDTAGRLHKSQFGEGGASSMSRIFNETEWHYAGTDLPSLIESRENDNANQYRHTPQYDALGRARKVTTMGAADMTLDRTFDSIGNVRTLKSPAMRGTSEYEYDGRGLMTKETLPAGGSGPSSTSFDHTASGVLEQYTDATGEATKTDHDGLGRPYKRTYPDGSTEEIHYELWRVLKVKNRQNAWQVFDYEPQTGRLDKVINAGVILDDLDYDPEGRLVRWKTPGGVIEFRSFDLENRPQLTIQTRYKPDGTVLDTYQQSHNYDGFGRRRSWSMPGAGALTEGWTTTVQPQYDGAGNVTRIDRSVIGGSLSGTILSSEFRTTGRPKHRTITLGPSGAGSVEVRREYDYEPSAGRLNAFRVFVNNALTAGSEVTSFEGAQLKSVRLLGVANGELNTSWDYDDRGRLRASAAAHTDPNAASSFAANTVVPELTNADFLERISVIGGGAPDREFGRAVGHKVAHTGAATNPFEYKVSEAGASPVGGVRTRDDHYIYEFDEKQRLHRATQRPYGGEGFILRVVYSYNGMDRVIGRRMEIAPAVSTTTNVPAESAFRPATAMELGPDAGLPPDTTFVWDPISDQLVAVFDAATGKPIRQYIHGGMGLDDPIVVTVAEGSAAKHYFPIYDEAGDGNLQAIIDQQGKIVTRNIIADPWGDDEVTLAGAAVEKVTLTRTAGDGVNVDVEFTEPIDASTLGAGMRLMSLTNGNTPLVTSSAVPAPAGDRVARWTLSAAQWSELASPPDAFSLSIAVTSALRSSAYTAGSPVLPANTSIRSGVYATDEVPFELRDTFTLLASNLAGSNATYNAYELTTLVGMPASGGSGGSSSSGFAVASTAQADSGALLLLTASFQAQSFMDPFTLKNYVRARWYDPPTGAWLSPDPMGYADSSNLYAFAGADPVNGRDPTGLLDPSVREYFRQKEQAEADRRYVAWCLANPEACRKQNVRAGAFLRVLGGVGQVVAGVGAWTSTGPVPEPITKTVGGVAIARGADNIGTGIQEWRTGESHDTLSGRGLYLFLVSRGVEPAKASKITGWTELGVDVVSSVGSSAVPALNNALKLRPINAIIDVGGTGSGVSNLNPVLGNTGGQTRNIPNLTKAYADDIARYFEESSAKQIVSVKLPGNYVNWEGFARGAYTTLDKGGQISMNVWVTGTSAEQAVLRSTIVRSLQQAGFKNVRLEGNSVGTMVYAVK